MNTITSTYESHAQNFSNKVAIQTDGETVSYADWNKLVNETAAWFHNFDTENRTVGIYMPNSILFLQLFTGAAAAGWTAVLFDMKWRDKEIEKRLALSTPHVVVTTTELYDSIKDLHSHVIVWDASFLQEAVEQELQDDCPFYLGFTSGSTGEPKAFIRSHRSWVASFRCNRQDFQMNETDHVLIPGALIHSHFLYGAISSLYLGATVYLLEKFSASQTIATLQTQPISVVYFVPTMIESILKEDVIIDRSVKILSSGAKWEADSKRRIPEVFRNLMMYEFYGASELSFVTYSSHEDNQKKPNSVGKPFQNVEIQVRKENGEEAAYEEIGKIYIKSEMLFTGYLQPNHTGIQIIHDEDGWVTVDDMGYIDEDGYLYIVGREKNMILYGGINIFPEEIESILSQHQAVEQVAVVGLSDKYWGQMVAAVIVGQASRLELQRLCKQHLVSYKIPRKWFFIEEMPLTAGGKIARAQVKEFIEGTK